MARDFPKFPLLPSELRLAIWGFAVKGWTQDIHFELSSPDRVGKAASFEGRKHIFAKELAVPPLLYTCHDSRVIALQHYSLGLKVEAKNAWSWRALHYEDPEFVECPYDEGLQECGRRTYWAQDSDVVMLGHGEEPYPCDITSICNSMPYRRHEYKLDERLRFMAITMEIWNGGTGSITLDVPSLEVLFVLVDRKPCIDFIQPAGQESIDFETRQEESCRIVEGQMIEAVASDSALFHLKRDRDTRLSVEVVLVESLDELYKKVGERRGKSKTRDVKKVSTTRGDDFLSMILGRPVGTGCLGN